MSKSTLQSSSQASSFTGAGAMTYPEGDLRYIWDGRGMRGAGATCSITDAEIRLLPRTIFRRVLGWPELVIPVREVNAVERLLFGRYRFRSLNYSIDGASFRPSGSKVRFERALGGSCLSIETPPAREKWRRERRILWNQMLP
jgi:hypothetical protein